MRQNDLSEPRKLNSTASCRPILFTISNVKRERSTDEFKVINDGCFGGFLEHVEVDICTKTGKSTFRVDNIGRHHGSKSLSFGFPCKCNDCIFHFDDLHGYVLFSNMEDFQIRE